jgi:hypothetical protein
MIRFIHVLLVTLMLASCTGVPTQNSEPGVTHSEVNELAEVSHDGTIPSGPLGPENYVGTIDRYGAECGLQNVTGHMVEDRRIQFTADQLPSREDSLRALNCMFIAADSDGANHPWLYD